jgi:proteasome lid subunit RPN8/RPN11
VHLPVNVSRPALEDMLAHAREALPDECCGLLIGRRHQIERIYRARNLQASPSRYLIDSEDHFAAIREARSKGQIVVGAYHSHPVGDPLPSTSDIEEASGGRDFLYVIVSPTERTSGQHLGAFRVRGGVAESVVLSVGGP